MPPLPPGDFNPAQLQETMLAATGAFAFFRGSTEKEMIAWLRRILTSKLAERVLVRVLLCLSHRERKGHECYGEL